MRNAVCIVLRMQQQDAPNIGTIYTIGHSTRTIETFIALLQSFNVTQLVDVRHFPASRKYPHFNKEALAQSLADCSIGYFHIEALGGRRKARPDSINTAWRHAAFKGYADYMETNAFKGGIQQLEEMALKAPTAYMCSEAVWWRCHRRLLADHLVLVHEVVVEHLFHDGRLARHEPTPEARRSGDHVVYDVGVAPALFDADA